MLKSDEAAYARVVRELEGVLADSDSPAARTCGARNGARSNAHAVGWRAATSRSPSTARSRCSCIIATSASCAAPCLRARSTSPRRRAACAGADVVAARLRARRRTLGLSLRLARHTWADTVVRPRSWRLRATNCARALERLRRAVLILGAQGDLGMTGVLRTSAPLSCAPSDVARVLRESTTLRA